MAAISAHFQFFTQIEIVIEIDLYIFIYSDSRDGHRVLNTLYCERYNVFFQMCRFYTFAHVKQNWTIKKCQRLRSFDGRANKTLSYP